MALIPENVQVIEIDADAIETQSAIRSGAADFYIDFENGRLTSQRITGNDKALQWLGVGCKTEKDLYPIYGEFGIAFDQLIEDQLPRDVIEGELVRGIEDLGNQHEGVEGLEVQVAFQGAKALIDVRVNGQAESVVRT